MAFEVPGPLLVQLRAYREERRRARTDRQRTEQGPGGQSPNFIDSIRYLFSGGSSVGAAATGYLRSMDSWEDEVENAHDAFLLYPGMGPMLYLTADGRILEDSRGWDGDAVVELTGDQANAALVIGAMKTRIPDLLTLIPSMPAGARVCPKCRGARVAEPIEGFGHQLPCDSCGSRGWVA
jgi:hypothetical protein